MGVRGQQHTLATLCPQNPSNQETEGLMGLRASLDAQVTDKILCPASDQTQATELYQLVY